MQGREIRYVWLDMNTGKFSNSWGEEEQKMLKEPHWNKSSERGWKLIQYTCINDPDFELYNRMRIADTSLHTSPLTKK